MEKRKFNPQQRWHPCSLATKRCRAGFPNIGMGDEKEAVAYVHGVSAAPGALACSRHAGLDRIVARQPERDAVHRGAAGYAYRIARGIPMYRSAW
jgi:hypothetical protein